MGRPLVDILAPNPNPMGADQLASIATTSSQALAKRNEAIRQAHDEGMSLRAIAEAVGMSHMGVKRIIDRATS